jgi:hypothetical protein
MLYLAQIIAVCNCMKNTSMFRFRSSSRMMKISSSVGILKGFLVGTAFVLVATVFVLFGETVLTRLSVALFNFV